MHNIRINPDAERRIRRGFPWVYSSDIDSAANRVGDLPRGELVQVVDGRGKPIGVGFASPQSLISVRLLGREVANLAQTLRERLAAALAWRDRLHSRPFYRRVFGEGDGLPGLVLDRHGDVVVAQTNTAGMDAQLTLVCDVVRELVAPRGILIKNDAAGRRLEGLPEYVEAEGDVPERVTIEESGVSFQAALAGGQKTGWYYDQRANRVRLDVLYRGSRVLDLYSYLGSWARIAMSRGAAGALCVDESGAAVESLRNAQVPGIAVAHARVEDYLDGASEQFDVVVIDPPAFVRRKKELPRGTDKYRAVNAAALRRCAPGALFVSSSCSAHLDAPRHLAMLRSAARQARRNVSVVAEGGLPPDHPVHPMLPESAYLTCWYLRVE